MARRYLLVDESKAISRAYGVLNEEKGCAQRATFVIGKDGRIAKVFPQVQMDGHSEDVLAALAGSGAPAGSAAR